MIASNFKIGALVPAICLVLLLCDGCSAGKGSSQKRDPLTKKLEKITKDFAGSGWYLNDQGKKEKLGSNFKKDVVSASEHGASQVLNKHRSEVDRYVKKLNTDMNKALRSGNKGASKMSNSRRDLTFIVNLARQAVCIVESFIGFAFPFKAIPEWKKKCCVFPFLRAIAPITCESYNDDDEPEEGDEEEETPKPTRKPRMTTKKPKSKKPKTTTPEPDSEETEKPDEDTDEKQKSSAKKKGSSSKSIKVDEF